MTGLMVAPLALTRVGDQYGALDTHCPHQGGPLGQGSIEKAMVCIITDPDLV